MIYNVTMICTVAVAYNLTPNNESFIKYIQLMSAITEIWNLSSVYIDNRNEIFENILEKLQLFKKSSKSCYNYSVSVFKIELYPD